MYVHIDAHTCFYPFTFIGVTHAKPTYLCMWHTTYMCTCLHTCARLSLHVVLRCVHPHKYVGRLLLHPLHTYAYTNLQCRSYIYYIHVSPHACAHTLCIYTLPYVSLTPVHTEKCMCTPQTHFLTSVHGAQRLRLGRVASIQPSSAQSEAQGNHRWSTRAPCCVPVMGQPLLLPTSVTA